jgi:tetratricopeptide (TPR) repeat protein
VDRKTALGGGGGSYIIFGDLLVEGSTTTETKARVYEIILTNAGGLPASRQNIGAGGRFQFINLAPGQYQIVVLLDNQEVGRQRVEILPGPSQERIRQDITLSWKANAAEKPTSISAADYYKRTAANEKLFLKAKEATDQKRYDDSIATLSELVAADPHDFLAWTELGTVYLFKQKYDEGEEAYIKSITERPTFFLGQMNLGRLRVARKNYQGAIEPLTAAVNINANSADANYYLGEAYLQIKKGSKAVVYLNQAIKLDPVGRADAHLRLATLYNAVGMKDKAAMEYEEFLKVKPEYPESKKLKEYIDANKPKN